ncbi:MAG: hypothetical protein ACTHQQ_00190 [Solirubrobacteraceae bacterium]
MALASPQPQTLVVFGASGDLARRKLFPALYDLAYEGLLPERYAIVGTGGSCLADAEFRERARGAVEEFSRHRLDEARWQAFARELSYISARLDEPAAFVPLRAHLEALDAEIGGEGRRLFYCATPPSAFPTIVERVGERGLGDGARVVLEKPIGHDLASAAGGCRSANDRQLRSARRAPKAGRDHGKPEFRFSPKRALPRVARRAPARRLNRWRKRSPRTRQSRCSPSIGSSPLHSSGLVGGGRLPSWQSTRSVAALPRVLPSGMSLHG